MYLGIDLGTTLMKCVVIGDNQEIICKTSSKNIPLSNLKSGWSEQDPKSWIIALNYCIKKLKKEINLKNIKSISFSGHMHGATCLDKNYDVIRKCIL